MRSQLFGFIVPVRHVHEGILKCPLNQAYEVTWRLVQQLGGIGSQDSKLNHVTGGAEIYTRKVETWFNQWDIETERIVRGVLREFWMVDELLRMELLQENLSWHWLKFREAAVITQIDLSLTIENEVHLMMLVGWNEGADVEDINLSEQFVQLYFARFQQLGIPYQPLLSNPPASTKPQSRPYGPRLDTAVKLKNLYEYRERERKTGRIISTRLAACESVGIALGTVKKYDKMLYDRWYDVDYKGST